MVIDLNSLSDEMLFYSNEQFYDFIEKSLGVDEMKLMKLQSIKSIKTLMNIPDVLAIFSFKCKEIAELKARMCFIDEDNDTNYIVKPGIQTSVNIFLKELTEKNNKYKKQLRNLKPSTPGVNNSQSNTSPSSLDVIDTQLSSTPSTVRISMSSNDYIRSISDSIEKFSLNTFANITLKNNNDYEIHLNVSDSETYGHIKCGCNTIIKLGFRSKSNSFQLSGYFKHIKVSHCLMMQKKKRDSNKSSSVKNDQSNIVLQDNDDSDISSIGDQDEETFNNESDTPQITTVSLNTNSSRFSKQKRSSLRSSTLNTSKKSKST